MPEAWLLVGVVLPLWWIAGGADWWLHRRSGIEDAGDPRESLLRADAQALARELARLHHAFMESSQPYFQASKVDD